MSGCPQREEPPCYPSTVNCASRRQQCRHYCGNEIVKGRGLHMLAPRIGNQHPCTLESPVSGDRRPGFRAFHQAHRRFGCAVRRNVNPSLSSPRGHHLVVRTPSRGKGQHLRPSTGGTNHENRSPYLTKHITEVQPRFVPAENGAPMRPGPCPWSVGGAAPHDGLVASPFAPSALAVSRPTTARPP